MLQGVLWGGRSQSGLFRDVFYEFEQVLRLRCDASHVMFHRIWVTGPLLALVDLRPQDKQSRRTAFLQVSTSLQPKLQFQGLKLSYPFH
ncbi:hypothetical protein EJ06DRAFT_532751 [Trichodelitschia bisporula]|uniref:Uncharacterized protein n=1 Tax=Trichodelitschia bisporula TaxID=703511 RepID=A0A6G1HPH9_9PEZI|nr:hypothetical protein EJ06DRAFT_532751 [Trichodelitschia bisporula]